MKTQHIANKGRYGDDDLLHVSKTEIAGLDALARSIYGHPLPRNPDTGRKEAFLFLPLLAGLGSAGMLGTAAAGTIAGITGGSALGAGLLAGGLGTAEAAARGMDDPLKHGAMAGLAGFGGAAFGNAAQAAANPAATSSSVVIDPTGVLGSAPVGLGGQVAAPSVSPVGFSQMPVQDPAQSLNSPIGDTTGIADSVASTTQAAPAAQPPATLSNWKTVMTDKAASDRFLNDPNTMRGVLSSSAGAMGQAQLEEMQGFREEGEAREAEKEEKYNALKNQIKQRYADVGRPGWWDQPGALNPNFAAGGRVQNEYTAARDGMADNYSAAGREIPSWLQGYGADMRAGAGDFGFGGGLLGLDGALISALVQNLRAQGADIPEGKSIFGRAMQQRQYAAGGRVFPMETGGFVVPKYAVDAAGGGSNEQGLMALKKKVGAKPIRGKGTGTSDSIPASIDGKQRAKVSNGEAYVPPKKVKKAGGAQQFYAMLDAAKRARKGV